MKIHSQQRITIFLLLTFVLALLLTACSTSESKTTTAHTAQPTPSQPVSGQQLLSGPVTYVALGASDAVGVGSNQPGSQGYVPLLANRLPQGSHMVNLGISGIHLHEALNQELPLALSTQPDLITIWLVANDFVAGVPYESYMQDLDMLLKELRAGTKAHIVMADLPDLTRLPAFARLTPEQKTKMQAQLQRWNSQIATTSSRYNVTVVDLYQQNTQLTTHPEYVSIDGFHPSPAGYAQLANYFWTAIQKS